MAEAPTVIRDGKDGDIDFIDHLMRHKRSPWAAARTWIVRQTLINHAFLSGFHYLKWSQSGLKPTKRRYENQVRMVVNLLRPLQRSLLGQVMRNKPVLDLSPIGDGDYADEAEVEVGRVLLKHLWGVNRMNFLMMHGWNWLFTGGNFAFRTYYDEEMGAVEDVPLARDGQQILFDNVDQQERPYDEAIDIISKQIRARDAGVDPSLEQQIPNLIQDVLADRFKPILEPKRTGEVTVQILSPFEFLADPNYLDLHEAPDVITEQARSLDWIKRVFGAEKAAQIVPEKNLQMLFDDVGGASLIPQISLPRITQRASGTGKAIQQEVAVVREYQCRVGGPHPVTGKPLRRGMHFVWCQNVALTPRSNGLPNEQDPEIDIVDAQFLPSDHFWSPPFFTDLIALVKANNRRVSQVAETMNAFAHPKLVIQRGTKLRRSSPTDQAGEVIEYLGVPPSYLEPPSVRSYVFKMMDLYMEQFNDVSMRHEVSRQGAPPPNVRTFSALQLLQEIDSEALVPTIENLEKSLSTVAEKMLDRVKEYYEDDRLISVVGENNKVEAHLFKAKEFFQRRYKVFVHEGSMLPEFRATRIQQGLEMLQYAPWLFVKPGSQTPDRLLTAQIFNRPDLAGFISDVDATRQAAEQENLDLDQGRKAIVFPFEDHEGHINYHMEHMRKNEFKLKQNEIQEGFNNHMQSHYSELQRAMDRETQQAQRIQQAAMQGSEVARQNTEGAAAGGQQGNGAARQAQTESTGLIGDLEQAISGMPGMPGGG